MEPRRKAIHARQKALLEQKLKNRLAFLAGKAITSKKADKDTIVRKWKADIKAINNRLRLMADHEKRSEEMAKIKAEKAAGPREEEAAPRKEKEGGKGEKPKKAPQEGKEKKAKPEKKAAPPKAAEDAKS